MIQRNTDRSETAGRARAARLRARTRRPTASCAVPVRRPAVFESGPHSVFTALTRVVSRRPPERIARYEIVERLATGGMAEILLGRSPGGPPVVIKRILPHLASEPAFVEMFLDEARLASRIHHPNVVQVQELGRDGEELYLVMEYLRGATVAELLQRASAAGRHLPLAFSAYVIAEACAGLHAAHELVDDAGRPLGAVHRDVSPPNLFVTGTGTVKVIDFGIAVALDRISRTEAGLAKGKQDYMSPEQFHGDPVDRRCDVFALGIVLYEMTTGRRLFRRDTPISTIRAICFDAIEPPSRHVPEIPEWLDGVVLRALARSPDDRFATTAEMGRSLREGLGSTDGLAEELAREVLVLFPERIGEGRPVRWSGAYTAVGFEPDPPTLLDIPVTVAPCESRAPVPSMPTSPTFRVARRPRGRGRALLTGALLGAMGFLTVRWTAAVPPTPAAVVVASTSRAREPVPRPAPTRTTRAELPAPAVVSLRIDSIPPGATVRIDDVPQGPTPLELRVVQGTRPLTLELRHKGYGVLRTTSSPDRDRAVLLTLPPRPRPPAPPLAPSDPELLPSDRVPSSSRP